MPNFGMMTAEHFLYIPLMLFSGALAGYVLGARAVRADIERKQKRMKE